VNGAGLALADDGDLIFNADFLVVVPPGEGRMCGVVATVAWVGVSVEMVKGEVDGLAAVQGTHTSASAAWSTGCSPSRALGTLTVVSTGG
jgi:hypothetical protein